MNSTLSLRRLLSVGGLGVQRKSSRAIGVRGSARSAEACRAVVEAVEGRVLLSGSALQPQGHLAGNFAHTTFEVEPMTGMGAGPSVTFGTPSTAALIPAQMRQAYGFNFALPSGGSATGAGETIAIVDAYHDPNIQSDLHVFDQQYFGGVDPNFTQVN